MMDISSSSGATQSGALHDLQRTQGGHGERKVKDRARRPVGADQAVISDRGQLLAKLGEAIRDSSDVREDKVAEIKAAVEQGRYQVSSMEIAKAILASRTE